MRSSVIFVPHYVWFYWHSGTYMGKEKCADICWGNRRDELTQWNCDLTLSSKGHRIILKLIYLLLLTTTKNINFVNTCYVPFILASGIWIHDFKSPNKEGVCVCVCVCVYIYIYKYFIYTFMHFIFSFKFMYLNALGWSVLPKHVAYIDETNV